jgi:beta-lactamase regulating signal transducer with metallopeptidase domain/Flp pilus assembly protein TadD
MFTWMLENTIFALILVAIVVPLCRHARLKPATCHLLWLLVVARLLVPPVTVPGWPSLNDDTAPAAIGTGLAGPSNSRVAMLFESKPLDLYPADFVDEPVDSGAESDELTAKKKEWKQTPWLGGDEASRADSAAPLVAAATDTNVAGTPPTAPPATADSNGSTLALLRTLGLAAWLAGSALVGFLLLRRALRFHRVLQAAQSAPVGLQDRVRKAAARLGVRAPELRLMPGIASPLVWSMGRPLLIWPAEQADALVSARGAGILAHELAHIRRRDHWVAWLEMAAMTLCWWNPVFWFARRRVHRYGELSCDAWAIWAYPEHRRDYAEALIDVVERMSAPTWTAPALAVTDDDPEDFERRLRMIMREKVSRGVSPVVAGLAILVSVALLPSWLAAQSAPVRMSSDTLAPSVQAALDDTLAFHDAEMLLEDERWDEAAEAWGRIASAHGDSGKAHHLHGYALIGAGRHLDAIEAFKRQSELGYKVGYAYYNQACAYSLTGDVDNAIGQLHRAIRYGFDDIKQFKGDEDLAAVRESAQFESITDALSAVKDANHAIDTADKHDDPAAKAAAWADLAALTPGDGEAWHMLSYWRIGAGDLPGALEALTRQQDLGFRMETALYNEGCTYALMGETDKAVASLEKAVQSGFDQTKLFRTDPDLASLAGDERVESMRAKMLANERLHREAQLAAEYEDWEAALEAWNKLAQQRPEDGWIATQQGMASFHMGDYAGALAGFGRQVHLAADVGRGLYNMACAYGMLGDADSAYAHLDAAISAGMHDSELIREDKDLGALRDDPRLEELARRADDAGTLQTFGASSWEQLLERSEAKVSETPDDGRAWHHLGWSHLRLGNMDAAKKAFLKQEAAGFAVNYARYNVACVHAMQGDADNALTWLERAIEAGMDEFHFAANDPDLANIHADPRFQQLIQKHKHDGEKHADKHDMKERKHLEKQKKEKHKADAHETEHEHGADS